MQKEIVIDLTPLATSSAQRIPLSEKFDVDNSLLPYPDGKFEDGVQVDAVCEKGDDGGVRFSGTLRFRVAAPCDRCLRPTVKDFAAEFDEVFREVPQDEDDYLLEGRRLNATKALQDALLLYFPTSFLCREDCKGLCPVCGRDRNEIDCGCQSAKENVFSVLKKM